MIKQKLVQVEFHGGQYHNFFFSPGSIDSLKSYIDDGWIVKLMKDEGTRAVVLFERGNP